MGWIRFHSSTTKVRPIQVIADIYGVTNGKSYVSTKYDFTGNVLQTRERHDNGTATPDVVVATNSYDDRGRLLTTSTSLNGSMPSTMSYVYDELGRLSSKKYANNTVAETYTYNIRGWLTEKNSEKFNMKLHYQDPSILSTTARYNGNISEWEWTNGTISQAYAFDYDAISRLTSGQHYKKNGTTWTPDSKYDEKGLIYDSNGNIKALNRTLASGAENLEYTYTGNQLTSLKENGILGSYSYDINGNMIKDSRKNLDYQYNSLNLLSGVDCAGISKVKYTYAADGTKLAVSGGGLGYDYRGSLIYKRDGNTLTLESAAFSDGRIIKSTGGYEVNYFITDHLGSVRTIFDASGSVKEQNDYYPFGGRYAADANYKIASDNRFKYNGKELQTTGNLGFLDYGARMYENKLGRWFGQDPAEQFCSPYNFCGNNPIVFVDPNGELSDWYQNDYGTTFWTDSSDPTVEAFGSSFRNIGSTLSIWDNNLGAYLNFYQNICLGMSLAKIDINRYLMNNQAPLGDLLNKKSLLDDKYKIDLMELSIQHTRLKFMENSVRAVFGGEHTGTVLTVAGTILAFTPYAPLSPLVLGLGQTYGYGNTAITVHDYVKEGNTEAAVYTVGITAVFRGSDKFFKYAFNVGNFSINTYNGVRLANEGLNVLVGSGQKTIENKKRK